MRRSNGLHFTPTNLVDLESNNIFHHLPVLVAMNLQNNNINSVSMILVSLKWRKLKKTLHSKISWSCKPSEFWKCFGNAFMTLAHTSQCHNNSQRTIRQPAGNNQTIDWTPCFQGLLRKACQLDRYCFESDNQRKYFRQQTCNGKAKISAVAGFLYLSESCLLVCKNSTV